MSTAVSSSANETVSAWAKRCFFVGRALMETALKPHGLGSTQWYVLYHLTNAGPTMQRNLVQMIDVDKATLSGIVSTLVRKGLVAQIADEIDQRQKQLSLTAAGEAVWKTLPDLTFIHTVAFEGIDHAAIETAIDVLRTATKRMDDYSKKGLKA